MVKKRLTIKTQPRRKGDFKPVLISGAIGAVVGVLLANYLPREKQRSLGFTVSNTYNRLSDKQGKKDRTSRKKLLLLGTIAGGIIGLTAYTIISNRHGKKGIIQSVKEAGESAVERIQAVDWADVAGQVVESLSDKLHEAEDNLDEDQDEDFEEEEEEEGPIASEKVQKIVDWAILGLNVWQNLKKRRR